MSRNGNVAELDLKAQELRAQGLTYREVGERMGEKVERAWRRCNRESVQAANQRRRAEIRRWERDHTTPCVDCGEPTSVGYRSGEGTKKPSKRCQPCEHERAHVEAYARTVRLLELRRQGLSNIEIAVREGTNPDAVAHSLQRSSIARFPDLEWLPAPYMQPGGRKKTTA